MTPGRVAIAAGCLVALLLGLLAGVEAAKHANIQYVSRTETHTFVVTKPGATKVVTKHVTSTVTEPGSTLYSTNVTTVHKPPLTIVRTITNTQTETVTETVTTTGTTGP